MINTSGFHQTVVYLNIFATSRWIAQALQNSPLSWLIWLIDNTAKSNNTAEDLFNPEVLRIIEKLRLKNGKGTRWFVLAWEPCSILRNGFADYWCGAALFYLTMCLAVRKEKMALYNHRPAIWPQKKEKNVGNCFLCRTLKREQEREGQRETFLTATHKPHFI